MLLKVGELARHAGLTVRTLHHYDGIGLLTPSARSDAGYRLYNRADIGRLHQIQALRRFGLSLADIGAFLANPVADLATVVQQQLAALARQMAQARELHDQLTQLHLQLKSGQEPELADCLKTLELMTMNDKYFSKEELKQIPAITPALREYILQANSEVAPGSAEGQRLAFKWLALFRSYAGDDPQTHARIRQAHQQEPELSVGSFVTPAMIKFVQEAATAAT